MSYTIDYNTRVITVSQNSSLGELVAFLKAKLPKRLWKQFIIRPATTTTFVEPYKSPYDPTHKKVTCEKNSLDQKNKAIAPPYNGGRDSTQILTVGGGTGTIIFDNLPYNISTTCINSPQTLTNTQTGADSIKY